MLSLPISFLDILTDKANENVVSLHKLLLMNSNSQHNFELFHPCIYAEKVESVKKICHHSD